MSDPRAGEDRAAARSGAAVGRLGYQPPYGWPQLIAFLRARAIPGVEAAGDEVYRRVVDVDGQVGELEVRYQADRPELLVALRCRSRPLSEAVLRRVAGLFDVERDPHAIARCLRADPVLQQVVDRLPGLRVPGAWDPFELGVRAILGQQVTVKGASTLAGRLVTLAGRPRARPRHGLTHAFPTPAALAESDLTGVGLPLARQRTLRAFAGAALDGVLDLPPVEAATELLRLPGIGDWTTQYLLMRAWRDADAFPASDLWLRRSAGLENPRALARRAEAWRPWRAYAAMYLWHGSHI